MKHISKYFPLFLTLLIIGCNYSKKKRVKYSDKNQTDNYVAKIDSLIQTTSPRSFNGIILITQKGEVKYSKAYGYSNFEDKTPIRLEDNFRIQSNSKQITAVLILKEVEKGTINLKDPIRKYLPNFNQTWADSVTVHQLLNMTSGIASINKSLLFKPGTDYKYSNPAYGLLGRIIENVEGKPYIEVAYNLFKGLKMENSFCYEIGKNENRLINGYRNLDNAYNVVNFEELEITKEWWKDFMPAGGIISNAKDLNIWDIALHQGKVLKPESYQLMIKSHIMAEHSAFGNEKIGYGYGVRVDDNNSVKIIGHAGRGLGFAFHQGQALFLIL